MKIENFEKAVEVPEDVEVSLDNSIVKVKGPRGEIERDFSFPLINIKKDNNKIIFYAKRATKKELKIINTFIAHLKNMFKGVSKGFVYKLKICSSHFPMNVSISGNMLIVKNFLGEKHPRTLKIKEGATVKVQGDIIIVESINKEIAGQVAADIESLTRRPGFDRRVFQDGIYIIEKDGKEI